MITMEYSSFSSLFAALGMATTSSPAAQPVADFSKPQSRGVSKKCRPQRMIYGFTFSPDQLEDWGRQHFGDTDDEKVLERYIKKSMGRLYYPCYHRWRRTTKHFVTYYTGPRRHEEDWCRRVEIECNFFSSEVRCTNLVCFSFFVLQSA